MTTKVDHDVALFVLRRKVDEVARELGDEALYGDVWRAALVLYDLTGHASEIDRLVGVVGQLDYLQDEVDRAVGGLAAVQRLIDHVRANGTARQRRRHRKLVPAAASS